MFFTVSQIYTGERMTERNMAEESGGVEVCIKSETKLIFPTMV